MKKKIECRCLKLKALKTKCFELNVASNWALRESWVLQITRCYTIIKKLSSIDDVINCHNEISCILMSEFNIIVDY